MQTLIEIFIGIILALGFVLLVRQSGSFAKEKFLLFIGLIITALIYVGFGLISGINNWIIIEFIGVAIYSSLAWLGWKKSSWFLAFGWAFHVAWDAILHGTSTPFVPQWYIGFCIGFDLAVAGYIVYREIKD
jgi:hypothetical protein